MKEARRAIRFPLAASVVFQWKDGSGAEQHGKGLSRDISELGLFIYASSCPPLGARIALSISLPASPDTVRPLRMQVDGQVLRVDESAEASLPCGFAVLSNEALLT